MPDNESPSIAKISRRLALSCLCLFLSLESQGACDSTSIDLQTQVTRVIDGDTVAIKNGQRIRLIGINTPEIGRRGKPTERFALQAKDAIQQLLKSSAYRVKLQYGQQRHDRYRRTLAHMFLADGRNVAEQLLLQGLAVGVAFPPNLWNLDCYRVSERRARNQHKALWQDNITPVAELESSTRGFRIVEGKVERVGYSKKSIWLNLGNHFSVRIAKRDQNQFQSIDFKQLQHQTLQVRGWIIKQKNKKIMRLRHSSMLEIVK